MVNPNPPPSAGPGSQMVHPPSAAPTPCQALPAHAKAPAAPHHRTRDHPLLPYRQPDVHAPKPADRTVTRRTR